MKEIIKSELYRLSKSTELRIMAIFLAGAQLVSYILYLLAARSKDMSEFAAEIFGSGFFDKLPTGTNDMSFRLLFIIMTASLVTKLYQTGVMKQLVSCGVPRWKMVIGQYIAFAIVYSILAVFNSLCISLCSALSGGSFTLTEGKWSRLLLAIFGMLMVVASLVAVHMFLAHLTASVGIAIALGIVVEIGLPTSISMFAAYAGKDYLSDYYLSNMQDCAIGFADATLKWQVIGTLGCIVYAAILLLLTIGIVMRREIK